MIVDEDSPAKYEPVSFEWRVTGYFTPDLLDDHIYKLAQGTRRLLKTCHWPAKELQYGDPTVDAMPLCSRAERNKGLVDHRGRCYLAMKVCDSHVSVVAAAHL